MKKSKLLVLLCFLTMLSCKENKTEAQSASEHTVINELISSREFKLKIEQENVQLIDVRTPEEFNAGHINNAGNIDFYDSNFLSQMNKLDKNKALYIYCRSGGRSGKAAKQLKDQGFTEVYDLQGGILDWKKNNFEVQKN